MLENPEDDGLGAGGNDGEQPGNYHHQSGSLLLSDCVDGGKRTRYANVSKKTD